MHNGVTLFKNRIELDRLFTEKQHNCAKFEGNGGKGLKEDILSEKRMKKRNLKRKGTAVIAAALAAGMIIPSMAFAAGPVVRVGTDSSVQMSSDPEVVYVNNYSGTTRSENFNDNWKFYLGDASNAEQPTYDDSGWEQVNLPHDYSIEQDYSQNLEAESGYLPGGTGWYRKSFKLDESIEGKRVRIDFGGVYMDSTVWVNGEEVGSHPYGYTPFSFDITDYVEFGADNVITVKVNHETPSSRWYSGSGIYRSVDLTITDPVHVDLYGTKIETKDLATEYQGETKNVTTKISTTVANDSDQAQTVMLKHTIFEKGGDADQNIGRFVSEETQVPAGSAEKIDATGTVTNPTLWSTEKPALYTVRTEVIVDNETVDTYDTEYGFRYFAFVPDTGFSLNGEPMKLKGVCMHHDQGSLGAEAWERAIERQVEILKEMGCNSIRVVHNPASDEIIEICNEQGILVIDEAFDGWAWPKNDNSKDYSRFFNVEIGEGNEILGGEPDMTWAQFDLTAMIKRGWNAPSVIMWSLGNEVQEGATGSLNQNYAKIQTELITWAQALDDTRVVTRGCNKIKGQTDTSVADVYMMEEMTAAGGTVGANYNSGDQYDALHEAFDDWIIYGSETASSTNSRGVYDKLGNSSSDQLLTAYDNSCVGWGALASSAWYEVITRDFVAGEYVWTGFDYIGEPTPWNGTIAGAQGTWPSPKNSYFGIVDTAGFPKDSYYFYQSQWNDDVQTLHILPAWNRDVVAENGDGNVPVVVYTDAAKVKLTLTTADGEVKDLGTKEFTTVKTHAGYTYQIYNGTDKESNEHKNLYLTWYVPFEEGTITAEAWDAEGNSIDLDTVQGRTSVTTTGEEAKLSVSADRDEITADGADLTYITVDITDADGNIVPDADDNVTFTVEGEGRLVGVDNGKQDDHQSYQDDNRDAFSGKVLAIVQSTKTAGEITVTASAEGFDPVEVTVRSTAVDESADMTLSYYIISRNYYVKVGNEPQLPETVTAVYSDGTSSDVTVSWSKIPEESISESGTFPVTGTTAEGDTLTVVVNMIDEVAALLNYSATVPVGDVPVLPTSRPAVLQDGEITAASFPVTWGEPDGSYDTAGTVTVSGTADVLGQQMEVTATIRVQEATVTIGRNIAGSATLSQDIPEGQQSDTLAAINDGSTEMNANTDGGANPSAWSNWTNTNQYNDNDAEIMFSYATQARIGKIVVYFAKDGVGLRYPNLGTTEIYISETAEEGSWTKVEATETRPEDLVNNPSVNVVPYTYEFAPEIATYVKLCIENPTNTDLARPSVAITEVEINEWTGSYTTNSDAVFTSMTVNGLKVSEPDLAAGSFDTEAILIDSLDYEKSENAAVTELPVYNGQKILIIESEDHSERNTFTINLGAEVASGSQDPEYADRDYTGTVTATAGSEHEGSQTEGPAGLALDNNYNTWWHTEWGSNGATSKDFWITLELNEVQMIDGLRYYGRVGELTSGASNGRVQEYLIEVKTSEEDDWQKVSTGEWENTGGWKLAVFKEPVEAKYVRLTGLHTYGEGGTDTFMAAAEIRVRLAEALTDISTAAVEPETISKAVSNVDDDHPVTLTGDDITVKLGDEELRYGVDYLITSYENNTAEGTATAEITGLGQYGYTGTKKVPFNITLRAPELEEIRVTTPCKVAYTEGETFDPSGLVLAADYDNDTSESISYAEHSSDITFSLADGTKLTADTVLTDAQDGATVTVAYGGKATTFTINVTKAAGPNPGESTKEDLQAAIEKAEGILAQTDKYTEGSLADYKAHVDAAKAVYEDPDATGADYETAIADLADAEELLVEIPTTGPGTGKPDDTKKPSDGSTDTDKDKAVQTGDGATPVLWGAAAILAGAAVIIAGRKRKSEK